MEQIIKIHTWLGRRIEEGRNPATTLSILQRKVGRSTPCIETNLAQLREIEELKDQNRLLREAILVYDPNFISHNTEVSRGVSRCDQ